MLGLAALTFAIGAATESRSDGGGNTCGSVFKTEEEPRGTCDLELKIGLAEFSIAYVLAQLLLASGIATLSSRRRPLATSIRFFAVALGASVASLILVLPAWAIAFGSSPGETEPLVQLLLLIPVVVLQTALAAFNPSGSHA